MDSKKKIIIISAIVIVSCLIIYLVPICMNHATARKLAKYGEEQFCTNNFDSLMQTLRFTEIDDIDASVKFYYDYKTDYIKEEKTLYLDCYIGDFTSEKIDSFYTQKSYHNQYDCDEKGVQLYYLMRTIAGKLSRSPRDYSYTMDDGKKVVVQIRGHDGDSLNIDSSGGHKYKYNKYISTSVKIDDVFVYYDIGSSGSAGSSSNFSSSTGSSSGSSARHTDSEAWTCAKKIVKDNLKSPSSAKFCTMSEATITHEGNGRYKVTGWVEAQNSFGAVVRQNFTVTYTATKEGFKDASVVFY